MLLPTLLVLLGPVLIAAAASGHSEDPKPDIDAGTPVSSRRDGRLDHDPADTLALTALGLVAYAALEEPPQLHSRTQLVHFDG